MADTDRFPFSTIYIGMFFHIFAWMFLLYMPTYFALVSWMTPVSFEAEYLLWWALVGVIFLWIATGILKKGIVRLGIAAFGTGIVAMGLSWLIWDEYISWGDFDLFFWLEAGYALISLLLSSTLTYSFIAEIRSRRSREA